MLLAAGEIHETAVGSLSSTLQIGVRGDLCRRLHGDDARLGRAVANHLNDLGELDERVHDRRGVLAAGEDVDVLRRLAAAAEAAAQLRANDAGHRADLLQERESERQREVDPHAVADLAEEGDPFQDLRLGLRAEAIELRDRAVFARGLQVFDRVDFQAVVERLHLLGADAGEPEHLHEPGRNRRAEVFEIRQFPGRDERGDLLLKRLADAANFAELLLGNDQLQVAFDLLNGSRRVVIGVAAE